MSQQHHRIKKQILELQLSSQQGAVELQNKVSEIYYKKIIPLIDSYCSQFSSPDTIHRIKRLEFNLDPIDINNLEEDLVKNIETQIQQQLVPAIRHSASLVSTQSQLERLRYFIQTGTVPWWSEPVSLQVLATDCDRLITTSPDSVKHLLVESCQNEQYLKRIIYQFPNQILLKLTHLLSASESNFIENYYSDLKILLIQIEALQAIPSAQLRLEQWQGLFLILLNHINQPIDKVKFTRKMLLHIATRLNLNYAFLINSLLEATQIIQRQNIQQPNSPLKSKLPVILSQIAKPLQTGNLSPEASLTQRLNQLQHYDADFQIGSEEKQSIQELTNDVKKTKDKFNNSSLPPVSINTFSDLDELYINNSGLIILAPFLNRFFETIGLVSEQNFINSQLAERAVLILQYLVDGTTDIPESILSLNKVLCGLDLLEPIEAYLEITNQEQTESENILTAVIHHWSILKNTSIDGFRRAFLQRKGKLSQRDGSWLLQVERETYDILLDHIPWSISVIKLSWMDELIYVEW